MRALPLLLLLALAPAARAAGDESDDTAQADGEAAALRLEALVQELTRQVAALRSRSADGDTRGMEQAAKALAEARDHLALLIPMEEPVAQSGRPANWDNKVAASMSDLRSALTLYSAEHDGGYPAKLEALVPKYLKTLPSLALPQHPRVGPTRVISKLGEKDAFEELRDSGGWLYVSDPVSPMYGSLLVDCTHQNAAGEEWYKQ